MIKREQQSSDDDIPAIIFTEWLSGKSLKEIAQKTRLDLATVARLLKRKQKSIPEKDR